MRSYQLLQAQHCRKFKLFKRISKLHFDVWSFFPVSCLNSKFRDVSLDDIDDLDKRATEITFLRLQCELDGTKIDKQVNKAGTLSFSYCIQFSVHSYSLTSKTVTLITDVISSSAQALVLSPTHQLFTTTPSTHPLFYSSGNEMPVAPSTLTPVTSA